MSKMFLSSVYCTSQIVLGIHLLICFYGIYTAASKDETVVTPAIVGAVIAMSIILILSIILCVIIVIKKRRRRSYKCHYNNEKNLCKLRNYKTAYMIQCMFVAPNQYPVLISQLNVKKRSTTHPPVCNQLKCIIV